MNQTAPLNLALDPQEILRRHAALKESQPEIRARNAAAEIGISEGELLAARIGDGVTRLQSDAEAILGDLLPLGQVMALTRNEACVHERKGVYDNASFFRHGKMHTGLFVNPDIDLRLFMMHWKFIFAVVEETQLGARKSLQFFDKSGEALHKIYLTNQSDEAAHDALVTRYTDADQTPGIAVEPYDPPAADRPDEDINWEGLRAAWENLKDTHAFFPMLKKFKVGREQALRRIGADFAYRVPNDAPRLLLDLARDRDGEIMVFTGNRGCIQIHTGLVKKLVEHGEWYNVLDPMFNLHLNERMVERCWVTRKPTEDGVVTAVEVFGKDGDLIVTFFGKRKPGLPELENWRDIVADLPKLEAADAV
ncbi:MAG: hemin-degrading factor [Alphaproteobacteria bacterium]|nr:MAG: hemin-degrading factor [Alphaproteobacteria bacterium]